MANAKLSVILDSRASVIDEDNRVWSKTFRTGGRKHDTRAFLLLSVFGLTKAAENPTIEINGRVAGRIRAYNGAAPDHWYTQMIPFNAGILERDADTDNTISINAVANSKIKVLQGDRPLDSFQIKDVLCFFYSDSRRTLDFKVIHGDTPKKFGGTGDADNRWRVEFDAFPGRNAEFAYLYCNIKGLTGSRRDVDMKLNGENIGDFDDYRGQDPDHWFTQANPFRADRLQRGENILELNAVGIDQDFFISNLVCFYQELVPRPLTDEEASFFGFGIIPAAVDKAVQATVVGDFAWMADRQVRIGDRGEVVWESEFSTPNRLAKGQAFLMVTLSGLTTSDDDPVVEINNRRVGSLIRYKDGDPKHAFTQMIAVEADLLNTNENLIKISAVGNPGGARGDVFDDFFIHAATCFFHRVAVSGQNTDEV